MFCAEKMPPDENIPGAAGMYIQILLYGTRKSDSDQLLAAAAEEAATAAQMAAVSAAMMAEMMAVEMLLAIFSWLSDV